MFVDQRIELSSFSMTDKFYGLVLLNEDSFDLDGVYWELILKAASISSIKLSLLAISFLT